MALKNLPQDRELVVRAPVVGHIPKGVWVEQSIAGGELCGFTARGIN